MVTFESRTCRTEGCGKQPSFGVAGTKTREYCAQHAPDGMVSSNIRMCRTEGCGKKSSFGVAGTTTREYCTQHEKNGMVKVCSKKCRTQGSGREQLFGVAGAKMREYCAQHAADGMVNICNRMFRNKGGGKRSFGVENSPRHVENVVVKANSDEIVSGVYTRPICGVERYRRREIDPHHYEEEAIGGASTQVVKRKTDDASPVHPSPPSGCRIGSYKRLRQGDIASTASTRGSAVESSAESGTLPGIDEPNFPAKRYPCVKMEVQLFGSSGTSLWAAKVHRFGAQSSMLGITLLLLFRRPGLLRRLLRLVR